MSARNDVKILFNQSPDLRLELAAIRQRVAAWADGLVAQWLARCAAHIEAAQRGL